MKLGSLHIEKSLFALSPFRICPLSQTKYLSSVSEYKSALQSPEGSSCVLALESKDKMCLKGDAHHDLLNQGCRYSVRVSPQMANRIVDSARSILNKFIPDIYIYTDHMKGVNSGKSPGFGLSLVAETTNGTFLSAELASNPQGQGAAVLPEDLGRNCAKLLLEEIYRGGCVDSTNQSLVLLLMTLGQQDVSKVLLGPLSPYTIEFLRHLKSFFQVMFKIETKPCGEELKGGDKVLMTCVGIGFSNLSKTLK
ncbi:RNA 3'-terminal phosphate cyclase-like protein isoform X4 [Meriones unguiculatus]|uniref:RNA 3'-terminal phosphate cyclase-like protein isoform X4 n=1 Tax=Meriones unguiculatus TaxID=10047 RepID=UPI000B4FCA34|nr:RNA 3'-terminal phosphate cyclase-like protein isoform X4 [Meriones unguiculatus]